MMRPVRKTRYGGYVLLELALSMAAMTVLMGGLASAVLLAGSAIPDDQSPLHAVVDGYYAAEQVAGELLCAQSFTLRSATAVEFTVADRDNDNNPETIRYEWSGAVGAPLTRSYNHGAAADVVADLQEFDLTYGVKTQTATTGQQGTTERYFVTSVGIALRVGSDPSSRVETAVQILNAPEVATP